MLFEAVDMGVDETVREKEPVCVCVLEPVFEAVTLCVCV